MTERLQRLNRIFNDMYTKLARSYKQKNPCFKVSFNKVVLFVFKSLTRHFEI